MGGVVSGIGDAVGGIIDPVSTLAGQIPGIGPIAGPVVGGIMGGPAGFASSLAGQALTGGYSGGGGGGSSGGTSSSTPMYAQPNISYGNSTYQYGGTPIKANPYFITGDRGVYNLLPALGQINAGSNQGMYMPSGFSRPDKGGYNKLGAAGSYTPYEAYQDIQAQMANDPKALAAFNKAFSPTTLTGPTYPAGSPMAAFKAANTNPFNQYVNYNLNSTIPGQDALTYNKLANYAVENQNPFFLPFETTQGATAMGFTPSANALAAIDNSQYTSGYRSALQAQQDYLAAQKLAQKQAEIASRGVRNPELKNNPAQNPNGQTGQNEYRNPFPFPTMPPTMTRPTTPSTPVIPPRPVQNNEAPSWGPNNNGRDEPSRPITPAPVTPTPTTPQRPGSFTPMARGGIAMLRRR